MMYFLENCNFWFFRFVYGVGERKFSNSGIVSVYFSSLVIFKFLSCLRDLFFYWYYIGGFIVLKVLGGSVWGG